MFVQSVAHSRPGRRSPVGVLLDWCRLLTAAKRGDHCPHVRHRGSGLANWWPSRLICSGGNTALYLPTEIQKDYPNDNEPAPATLELSADVSRLLSSYLNSRWKDSPALFPSRSSDRITPGCSERDLEDRRGDWCRAVPGRRQSRRSGRRDAPRSGTVSLIG